MRRIIFAALLLLLCTETVMAEKSYEGYEWAEKGIEYCFENKIMTGDEYGRLNPGDRLTREQMAKMTAVACNVKENGGKIRFSDISEDMWSYSYILRVQDFVTDTGKSFRPYAYATREDFIASVIYASEVLVNVDENVLDGFSDIDELSEENREALNAAVFHGYIKGDENGLRPKDSLTRAEACVFLERVLNGEPVTEPATEPEKEDIPQPTDPKYKYSKTSILGESVKTEEEAVAWARRNNAAQIFVDAAPLYWKYGDVFGIRADVMYAQAAKETGFGRYTGKVKPEMNNWAGIKKYGAVGDETEDHESFATPEDGVRGHFNHMSAYVGVEPVGEVHGRYSSVKSLSWAGTVKYVEQLGGKWCPDVNYGYSILADYVDKM